ncbi:MAG: DEAD/DEAH box helicase, partial [bacterium]|nr:DEAD/DEAH box helicase [bacterium]
MLLPLETPLDQIKGIGPKFIVKLKSLKIETVKDLLWHFPNRYEDFSKVYPISELTAHQEATVTGIVESINVRRSWRRRFVLTEAVISDDSGSIRAIWFNQPYLRNILQPGRQFNFSGKVVASSTNNDLCLSNPIYEFINNDSFEETKHTARLVPIYPETRGLTSKTFRYLIKPLLEQIMEPTEILSADILKKRKFPKVKKALRDIHFPDDINDALEAKKRFAFESLFLWQLVILRQKFHLARQKAISIKYDLEKIKKDLKRLPFELTQSQKKSLWEILQDIEKSRPMNRLLQGDVGSGKTIIAAMAAITTALNDKQAAFMAPTEILARQHYQTLIKFFPEFEKGITLLTGQEAKVFYGDNLESKTKKTELVKDIAAGKIKIIVGTHALIQKTISFKELALVIVDEQHRFGIKQRAELLKNSQTGKPVLPHFLSMSATPIPRTLSLTLFGDLDLSLITELPKDRKPIITKTVAPTDRNRAYQFIREQIKKG